MAENFPSPLAFSYVYLPIAPVWQIFQTARVLTLELFAPNYVKYAIECV